MSKIFVLTAVLAFSLPLSAQHKKEKIAIKKVIATFFKGLHQADSTLLKTTLHNDIKLQTIVARKKGGLALKTETKSNLLKAVVKLKAKDVYLEKLLGYTINWKIIYLVDTRRRADCKDAKQKK